MKTSTASLISVSEFFFVFVFVFQTSKDTTDIGAIQKAADFVQAFLLGFEVCIMFFNMEICIGVNTVLLNYDL